MTKGSKKFIQQYYRATVDSMLLLLKTNLILNSCALVSILLLDSVQRTVMFALMTWPGVMEKYRTEIELRLQRIMELAKAWEPHSQTLKS